MRRGILALGIIIAVAGALLFVVPVSTSFPPRTWDYTVRSFTGQYVSAPRTPDAPITQVGFAAAWSSAPGANQTNKIEVFDCGYQPTCNDSVFQGAPILRGIGPSGELTWNAGAGELFEINPANFGSNVTVTTSYHSPVAGGLPGIGVVGIGGVLVAAGTLLRRGTSPSPPPSVGGAE